MLYFKTKKKIKKQDLRCYRLQFKQYRPKKSNLNEPYRKRKVKIIKVWRNKIVLKRFGLTKQYMERFWYQNINLNSQLNFKPKGKIVHSI